MAEIISLIIVFDLLLNLINAYNINNSCIITKGNYLSEFYCVYESTIKKLKKMKGKKSKELKKNKNFVSVVS